jgi:S1-C subfamily serine protease
MNDGLKTTSKSGVLLTIGVALTLLNTLILLGMIGFSVYQTNANKDKQDKLVLAGVNSQDVADLTAQLSYSGSDSEEEEYYSPTLDLLIKYDSTQLYLSDGSDSIIISPKAPGTTSVYANIRLLSKTSNDPISNRSAYYESIYDGVKRDEEGKAEGLDYAKLSYAQTDILDETKKSIVHKLIVYREIDNKYVYAELNYPDGYDVGSITTLLADILNSADLAPEGIADEIKIKLKDPGVEFSYNKDMWTVDSVTDSSAALSFRSRDFEEDVETKSGYAALYVSSYTPSSDATVQGEHDQIVSYGEENSDYKLITDSEKLQFGGVDFIHSVYSYSLSGTYYKNIYTAQTEDKEYIIYINSILSHPESVASKQIGSVLESLVFTEESKVSQIAQNEALGNVLGTSSIEIDKSAIIGKPAVVHIFNRSCANIKVAQVETLPEMSGNTYDVCMAGFGSGFFVSKDGYIVTNGHVATPDPLDTVMDSFWYNVPLNSPFWDDLASDLYALAAAGQLDLSGYSTEDLYGFVLGLFVGLVDEQVFTVTSVNTPYIEKGIPFTVDVNTLGVSNASELIAAEVVDGKVDSSSRAIYDALLGGAAPGITTPDLAILKVNATEVEEFPTLDLSDPSFLSAGQKVVVIGFPGSADNRSLFSATASRTATITNGVLSAIKPNVTDSFDLLQIDASVSGGNSGGPILDGDGNVVGVTTYGVSSGEAADYNAGVSVEEVSKFLSENSVTVSASSISQSIESGVENMSKEYYKMAVADFNDAKEKYPLSAEILDPLIAISNDKIESGEDKTPAFDLTSVEDFLSGMGLEVSGNQTIIILVAAAGLLLSSTLVTVLFLRKRMQNASFRPPVVGNQPVVTNEPPVQSNPPATEISQTPVASPDPMLQQTTPIVGNPATDQQIPVTQPPISKPPVVSAPVQPATPSVPPVAPAQPPIQTQLTTPTPVQQPPEQVQTEPPAQPTAPVIP